MSGRLHKPQRHDRERGRSPGKKDLDSAVLEFVRDSGGAVRSAQIAQALRLGGKNRKKLQSVLAGLVRRGLAVAAGKDCFSVASPGGTVAGRISVARSGDGFVSVPGEEEDVRIAAANLGTALPGDTVRISRGGGRRAVPRVTEVVERGRASLVGTLKTTGRFDYVVPIDPSYDRHFRVSDRHGAVLDDRVVVRIGKWDSRHEDPEGEIVETLGPASSASLDTVAILRHYGYSDRFPEEVTREAAAAGDLMSATDGRIDLRDKFILTIDPLEAKDFDDALSLEVGEGGRRVIGVHIADVSHFVRPGAATDEEAARRGNSVYFPDQVIPMLPPALSNDLCSLVPGADRLAFSVFITVDDEGQPVSARFARTVIRSSLRLTYEQAMTALNAEEGAACPQAGMTPENVALLKRIGRLSMQFRRRRFAAGALDLDMPEYEVVLGPDGSVTDVRKVDYDPSHQLVEECMVAANEAVDRELSDRGLPIVHRIHEPPTEKKMEELTGKLVAMGLAPGDLRTRRNIVRLLKSVESDPLGPQVKTAVLRSMCKAEYSAAPKGHFGLAKRFYAHFTSPIRRYPDLVVHRILGAVLAGKPSPYGLRELQEISRACSITEQMADEAERTLTEIKKFRLLERECGSSRAKPRRAVVVAVSRFGLFVELTELQVQGLVHASELGGGRAHYNKSGESLTVGRQTYRVRDAMDVVTIRVDFERRRLDFAPVS